jgi:hypothetical protein
VLRYTLANNDVEDFDDNMLAGFGEATKQVTEVPPEQSSPYDCEVALYRAGLSWLPEVEEAEMDEDEGEES